MRGNFLKASKGGAGFQEGHVRIDRSIVAVYQYPPNKETGRQSDPFCAMVWTGVKLTPDWKEMDGDDNGFEIVHRMGNLDVIRPGKLEPKDFDNMDASPEDLGNAVGTEGNSFHFEEESTAFGPGWNIVKDSLEKHGFKASILGRGVASDFEGTVAHFLTQEGSPYVARQDGAKHKKGDTIKPTNLVCDKIHTFGYEVEKGKKGKGASTTAKAGANGAATTPATTSTPGEIEPGIELQSILSEPSDQFKAAIVVGKAVKRGDFNKQLTNELMRKKIYNPKATKAIMDYVKSEEFAGFGELTGLFTVDGDTVTLVG